jgi:hypothetical protein
LIIKIDLTSGVIDGTIIFDGNDGQIVGADGSQAGKCAL